MIAADNEPLETGLPPLLVGLVLEMAAGSAQVVLGPLRSNKQDSEEPRVQQLRCFSDVEAVEPATGLLLLQAASVSRAWQPVAYELLSRACSHVALPPDLGSWQQHVAHPNIHASLEACLTSGRSMSCPPPPDASKLRALFARLRMAPCRFASVRRLHLANYAMDDAALEDVAALFPALWALTLFGGDVTHSGLMKLTAGCCQLQTLIVFYCPRLTAEDVVAAACPARLPRLKKIFFLPTREGDPVGRSSKVKEGIPTLLAQQGLSLCSKCYAWFPTGSRERSCLHHPGTYAGYGASCSSYSCCGSMKPGYPCTPGCTYDCHMPAGADHFYWKRLSGVGSRIPVMELFDTPYEDGLFCKSGFWLRDAKESRFGSAAISWPGWM
mmetsp:Transcript_74865/g.173534  ORF Transcript_74865/g.173534 Transcript_74865/m.173534 type:complete len:383 (-) Transcript_74865:162-1310(-)